MNITPPLGQRTGQALYNWLFWLQDKYQTDTFYMSEEDMEKSFNEWKEEVTKNMCKICGKPLYERNGQTRCIEFH